MLEVSTSEELPYFNKLKYEIYLETYYINIEWGYGNMDSADWSVVLYYRSIIYSQSEQFNKIFT